MIVPTLREVKRAETRRALSEAAFELACERGLDHLTTDDIVERAGYSRRTFANYFSGKEEAVVAAVLEVIRAGIDQAPSPPSSASDVVPWLEALARAQFTGPVLPVLDKVLTLAEAYPSLRPYLLDLQRQIRTLATTVITESLPGDDLDAHLLVGALFGAISPVFDGSIRVHHDPVPARPGSIPADRLLTRAFSLIHEGFRAP